MTYVQSVVIPTQHYQYTDTYLPGVRSKYFHSIYSTTHYSCVCHDVISVVEWMNPQSSLCKFRCTTFNILNMCDILFCGNFSEFDRINRHNRKLQKMCRDYRYSPKNIGDHRHNYTHSRKASTETVCTRPTHQVITSIMLLSHRVRVHHSYF